MPELPETETIARDLDGALRGAVVRSFRVQRGDVLGGIQPHHVSTVLHGETILGVHRRAKSVVITLSAHRIVVTPRFTGVLQIFDAPLDDPYRCVTLELADGRTLAYRDVRRLGTFAVFEPDQLAAWESELGPEPLDPALTAERFSGILRGSSRAVKAVLMDQHKLAGVGNIYSNEACWRAGIRPSRRARTVTRAEARALLEALRAVLRESIALRGTTFRDYRDAFGGRGGFAEHLAVYGRGDLPCPRCATTLKESHAIDRRSTVWCPRCQR